MKNIICAITFHLLLNLIGGQDIFGQSCYLDSINNQKLFYNQSGRLSLIRTEGILFPETVPGCSYNELHYNSDSLLSYVTAYSVSNAGDTIDYPYVTMTYTYSDSLLSQVNDHSYAIFDDFIWSNNKIIEFKYYYLINDTTIDSTQTRVLHFTYLNNNISHFLYKELTGTVYSDDDYLYDSKYNPYYQSEIALVQGDLLRYSCANNWISCSNGASREIDYNSFDYPVEIFTDWNNGNVSTDTFAYDCLTTSIDEVFSANENDLELLPNPANDFFKINNNYNQDIKQVIIFDLNGVKLFDTSYTNEISVRGIKSGLYIVECIFENFIIRKKIIIYAS